MKLYIWKILLLGCLLFGVVAPDYTPAVQAATTSQAAAKRAKEAEKAKKKREADKARKAKKRAKDKARREAEKARKKALSDKQKARKMESREKEVARKEIRDEQEEYRAEVARIKAHNQRVLDAQRRNLTHSLGVWGYFGYSSIFQNYSDKTSIDAKSLGGFGGAAGLGYQFKYDHFLLNTGVEFEMYNSNTRLSNNDFGTYTESFNVEQYPSMHYNYEFKKLNDYWQAGYVNIPVLLGGEFDRYYFLAGPKVGIGVLGSSTMSANMTTTITDDYLIGDFNDMYNHALVNDEPLEKLDKGIKFNLNLALHAEAGIYLDEWIHPQLKKGASRQQQEKAKVANSFRYRLGVFADFGVLNTKKTKGNFTSPINYAMTDPIHPELASALYMYEAVDDVRLHPFMVGVKLAIFYDLPKKEQKLLALPPEPLPRMAVKVTNAETEKPLSGAMLSIYEVAKDRTIAKTTGKSGLIIQKNRRGDYKLHAEKPGFFPSDTLSVNHQLDLYDTILIALKPEPKPIEYFLCGYVWDAESKQELDEVQISLTDANANSLYVGTTSEDGMFVTNLKAGSYIAHLSRQGYMPADDTITFVQDTLMLYLQKIKEGKKVRINNLFFATNKTQILPESEQALEELATFLTDNPTVEIMILGHTDAVGSDAANQKLSEGRANAVRSDLIMRGIDGNRITAEGRGESEPVADNETEEGRALNRRVEFTITATGGEDIKQILE